MNIKIKMMNTNRKREMKIKMKTRRKRKRKMMMNMEMHMTMKMAMISGLIRWFYLWRLAPPRGARDELRVAACPTPHSTTSLLTIHSTHHQGLGLFLVPPPPLASARGDGDLGLRMVWR